MFFTPTLLPEMLQAVNDVIAQNAEEVTALDQAIGDGDHVFNLQRGLHALLPLANNLTELDWAAAWQKIGMTIMSTVGGASGSLYGTLFLAMSKASHSPELTLANFAEVFTLGVEAVKHRGKAEQGEKTMLDVLIPVAQALTEATTEAMPLVQTLHKLNEVAEIGVAATRDMLATKGRASFLEERSLGHIDAGAKTAQLMIAAIVDVLLKQLATASAV